MTTRRDHRLPGIILAFAAIYLIWGSNYGAVRLAVEGLPPLLMAGGRFLIAGAGLLVVLRARGERLPPWRAWRRPAMSGLLMLLGASGLGCWAALTVASGLVAVCMATAPLWLVLFEWLFFGERRPGPLAALAIALGFAGVLILIGPTSTVALTLATGAALAVAPMLWALGLLCSRARRPGPASSWMLAALQMIAGGGALTLGGVLRGETETFHPSSVAWSSWLAWAYLIVAGSILGFGAFVWLQRQVTPAAIATHGFVNPLVAVVVGHGWLQEPLTAEIMLGAALVILSVILLLRRGPAKRPARTRATASRIPLQREGGLYPSSQVERLAAR